MAHLGDHYWFTKKKNYCEVACDDVTLWNFRLHFEPSGLPPLNTQNSWIGQEKQSQQKLSSMASWASSSVLLPPSSLVLYSWVLFQSIYMYIYISNLCQFWCLSLSLPSKPLSLCTSSTSTTRGVSHCGGLAIYIIKRYLS